MFILIDKSGGGVYAVNNNHDKKNVNVFEQKDDAVRYKTLLEAGDYKKEIELMEIDTEAIAINCEKFGYEYSIVSKADLVVPPL